MASRNPDRYFRVFICLDRESRYGLAPIDFDTVRQELKSCGGISFKNIDLFEAVQDIESWFFHDIEGIFQHLRLDRAHRIPQKYRPVERLNNVDMSNLFKLAGREYRKGFASQNFTDGLDLQKIRAGSSVLERFIHRMQYP